MTKVELFEQAASSIGACDVCGNTPDNEGDTSHGRGCHVVCDDGGGSSSEGNPSWKDYWEIVNAARDAIAEVQDELGHRKITIQLAQTQGVWYWQGDAGDHLESMSNQMPILITAEKMRAALTEVQRERDELAAIVAKLPKTADDVPITSGMTVYPPCGHSKPLTPHCAQPLSVDDVECWEGACKQEEWGENDYHDTSPTKYKPEACFSTVREAHP